MLRLSSGQVESLFDEALPVEVCELPEDLAALDALLSDPALLAPIERAWRAAARDHGRPTVAMAMFVRLMVVKQRTGWGYETLVREVSDSLHLRRFCLVALSERVPDESTVRKLTRRLGPEVIDEITRAVIGKACRETRFRARAVRIDSTVVEADVRYPSDAVLALQGARALAREGRKLRALVRGKGTRVVDRSRQIGRTVRAISRTLARRAGRRTEQVIELNAKAGRAMARSLGEARRLAAQLRASARGRGAQAKLRAARALDELAGRCERVVRQIEQRLAGQPIKDRLVSLADPDARPIRKGKLGKPNEFGYVAQIAEVTQNTRRGARGYVLPAPSAVGNVGENTLLPETVSELERLRLKPREVALDGAFGQHKSNEQLAPLDPERVFVSGRQEPGSRRTRKRLQRYRTGAEGRISHLKRGYGLRRSRLKGQEGQRIWTGWGILAYNLDTLAVHSD
ncbi:MAG: transposase [Actinobacteria bacterium]|nr:transposase [Actinomycetota bacterium]